MKKLFCGLLALCVIFAFAGCGKAKTSSGDEEMDFEYFLKLGKIPECSYALGADVSIVKAGLSTASAKNPDSVFEMTEGERSVRLMTNEFTYYYEKAKEAKGLSYIIGFGTSFGLSVGTISIEVEEKLATTKLKKVSATADDAFFMPTADDYSVLKYTQADGDNVILFVFVENGLCAVAVYDSSNWTI